MCVSKQTSHPFLNPSQDANTGDSGMVNTPIAPPMASQTQPGAAQPPTQAQDPNQNPNGFPPGFPPGLFPGMFPGMFGFPSMHSGGPVTRSGLYNLKKGEEVIPAGKVKRGKFRGYGG